MGQTPHNIFRYIFRVVYCILGIVYCHTYHRWSPSIEGGMQHRCTSLWFLMH